MNNGFYLVATLDRMVELEKFLKSLRRHHTETIMLMIANNMAQAHEFKTLSGSIAPFDNTIMMDIDMYVLQNFGEVFDIVRDGKVAIWEEKRWGIFNSGFVAFNRSIGRELSKVWHKVYVDRDGMMRIGPKGLWDQDILTNILKSDEWKGKVYELPRFYNYCVSQIPPPPEEQDWDKIKVLHYWHRGGYKPDTSKRSWRVWLGEKIMPKKDPSLVDEINRLLELYRRKPRMNTKRIALLEHLLEVHGIETGAVKPEKPKDWDELEKEKKEATKQEKKRKSTKKKDEE